MENRQRKAENSRFHLPAQSDYYGSEYISESEPGFKGASSLLPRALSPWILLENKKSIPGGILLDFSVRWLTALALVNGNLNGTLTYLATDCHFLSQTWLPQLKEMWLVLSWQLSSSRCQILTGKIRTQANNKKDPTWICFPGSSRKFRFLSSQGCTLKCLENLKNNVPLGNPGYHE